MANAFEYEQPSAVSRQPISRSLDLRIFRSLDLLSLDDAPDVGFIASSSNSQAEPSLLSIDEWFALVRRVGEECIQEDELRNLLEKKPNPICYDGFEPSGRMHIAQLLSDYGLKQTR